MSNSHSIWHFEIPADETEGLKSFYSSLFGWQFEEGETKEYWLVKNAGLSGGLAPKESPEQMPTIFVTIESLDYYLQKAEKLEARVAKDKQEMSGGYFAVLEDLQKNAFGIWQQK
jgi:predicted enzyme related to lactoylglutathione lyase